MRDWRGTRARHRDRRFVRVLQRAPQRALDLADALVVGDGRAVFFEHVVEVEAEAIAGGRDARVDDVEAELVEHRRGDGEAVVAMRRERQDGRGAALARGLHRDQRLFAAGLAVGEQLGVPGHFLGRVPQEVGGGEPFPGARDFRRGDPTRGRPAACARRPGSRA